MVRKEDPVSMNIYMDSVTNKGRQIVCSHMGFHQNYRRSTASEVMAASGKGITMSVVGTVSASSSLSYASLQGLYNQAQQYTQQQANMPWTIYPSQSGAIQSQLVQTPKPPKPKKEKVMKKKSDKNLNLGSVIMSEDKREQIRAAISQIKNNKTIFQDWGFDEVFEKGTAIALLFYGTPGTGKTLTAQAIANELNADLKIIGTADLESSEPGAPERTMKQLFEEARQALGGRQRIILFDECDSLLSDRNEAGIILGAQINALLGEIERHTGVVIFTTNRLGKLDPALERRISAKIEFEFPDESQRLQIWKRLIPSKCPLDEDVSFEDLAKYVIAGGNIKNVVLNAARMAAYEKSKAITMDHFIISANKEVDSLDAWSKSYEAMPHYKQGGIVRTSTGLKAVKETHKEEVLIDGYESRAEMSKSSSETGVMPVNGAG